MKLTEQSTVAEHLKALAKAEPEKFVTDGEAVWIPNTNIGYWPKDLGEQTPNQDDWDSILREIGYLCFAAPHSIHLWQGHYAAIKDIPTWKFTKDLFPIKKDAIPAAGCAAIREHLKGKP